MAVLPITDAPITFTNQNAQTITIPAAMALPSTRPAYVPEWAAAGDDLKEWTPYGTTTTGSQTWATSTKSWVIKAGSSGTSGILSPRYPLQGGGTAPTLRLTITMPSAYRETGSGSFTLTCQRLGWTEGFTTASTATYTTTVNVNDTEDPATYTMSIGLTAQLVSYQLRLYIGSAGAVISINNIDVTVSTTPWKPAWGAGALPDGHLDGFFSLPNMTGAINDNPVTGGGLAPANPQFGSRPVSYVAYCSASTRQEVMAEVKRITAILAVGKIRTEHHGLGWCWNGWLASPPDITWLAYDYPAIRLDWTITYTDPVIWQVDFSQAKTISQEGYNAISNSASGNSGTAWYYCGAKDMSSSTSTSFAVRNYGQAVSYPYIFFTFGPSTNTTYPRATYFDFYKSGDASAWYWHVGPIDWDDGNGYTSWMIDTRAAQLYGGWTQEDKYAFKLLGSLVPGASMAVQPNSSYTLYVRSESGVGSLGAVVPQGRI